MPQSTSFLEEIICPLQHDEFCCCILVAGLGCATRLVETLLECSQVRDGELELDHLAIARGIDAAHHVRHVLIVEAADDMNDRVGLANVREKLVAKSFTISRALDQAGDVDELHDSGNDFFWMNDIGELAQSRVGNFHHPDVRLDGAERIVRRLRTRSRKRVEECRFSDVWESYDAEL